MCAAPMGMLSPGGRQPGGDVLASWAESLASRRDEMRGRGCLRFAFYGRVSTRTGGSGDVARPASCSRR